MSSLSQHLHTHIILLFSLCVVVVVRCSLLLTIKSRFHILLYNTKKLPDTEFKPTKWTATETKKVYFCACKQSKNGALCDGSHKKLPEDAEGKCFSPGCL